jgi:hypothetical protein
MRLFERQFLKLQLLASILFLIGCSPKTTKEVTFTDFPGQEIRVSSFGAKPNDNLDDSEAIQSAIQSAIQFHASAVITFEPGIYDLFKGIVVANLETNGELFFITMHLKGHAPAIDSDQRIGATTVLKSHSGGFALAIQKARNCVIENIAFESSGPLFTQAKQIVESKAEDWKIGMNSINPFSPHCAIAIDPFINAVSPADRYPDEDQYYTNSSTGGSSLLLIRGCAFTRFYIAIANNPSNGICNGDNIRAEQCYVGNCHTFWSCGQTQSRDNQVSNIYALSLNTFISGVEIGKKQGTPPFVSHVNIAGFCKYVFNVQTGFSGLWVADSHMESIWSLGIALTNAVSFDRCQIQFQEPVNEFYVAPFHLYNRSVVEFRDCAIEYFSNCTYRIPFMFISRSIQLSGGWVEGGIVVPNGYTNEGGEEMNNITYDNVYIKCLDQIAGKNSYARPIENLGHEILSVGTTLKSNDQSVFTGTGNTYSIYQLGDVMLTITPSSKKGSFQINNPGIVKVGDILFSDQIDSLDRYGLKGAILTPAIGYISEISGSQVAVTGIPDCLRSGRMKIYVAEYPVFIPPIWGNVESGSNVISEVVSFSSSFFPSVGTRINLSEFPAGTYVLESNPSQKNMILSTVASHSSTGRLIKNADYIQDIYAESWNPETIAVIIEGARVHLKAPFNSSYELVNTSKGISGTMFQAKLKAIEEK